jgi:hypothetical protein
MTVLDTLEQVVRVGKLVLRGVLLELGFKLNIEDNDGNIVEVSETKVLEVPYSLFEDILVGETELLPDLEIILELEEAVTETDTADDLDTLAVRDETNDLLPKPELELEAELHPEYVKLADKEDSTEAVFETSGETLALDIELPVFVPLELLLVVEEADKVRDCLELWLFDIETVEVRVSVDDIDP